MSKRDKRPPKAVAADHVRRVTMDWDPDPARISDPATMRLELADLVAVLIVEEYTRLRGSANDYKDRGVSERLMRGLIQLRMDLDLHEGPDYLDKLQDAISRFERIKAEVRGGKPSHEAPPSSTPTSRDPH